MRRTTPVLLAVALCAALTAPAQARLFGDDADELRKQINDLGNRVDTMTRNEFERTNRFESMRAELNDLRGQIEVLQHRLDNMEQHQRDVLADFDRRLQALGGGGASYGYGQGAPIGNDDPFAAFAGGGQPIGMAPSGGNEAGEYEAALAALKAGKQAEALAAFNRFIASYPTSASLPDAHFWAGTAAIQQRDIAAAQNHYQTVLDRWPDSRMAPDAMLGLANTQQALGDHNGSQATLKKLVATYGDSNAAKIARDRLGR